jgi:hypothetical protein
VGLGGESSEPEEVSIVAGGTYEFICKVTRNATYVHDGVTYRVAHASGLILIELADLKEPPGLYRAEGHGASLRTAVDGDRLGMRLDSKSLAALTSLRNQLKK